MSAWSLECDLWESKLPEGSKPSNRHAFAAGWNRHKEKNKDKIIQILGNMTPEERVDIFRNWCKWCGYPEPCPKPCYADPAYDE